MSNDDTAPDAPRDKTLTWMPIAAAATVAVVVAAVIFFAGAGEDNHVGVKTASDGSLVCPDTNQGGTDVFWVPVDPSGVDGEKSLVPDAAPSHVTVCRYDYPATGKTPTEVNLTGHVTLTAGLRDVTKELSAAPKSKVSNISTGVQGATDSRYLLGLNFATGLVWVAVPGSAEEPGASNGRFTTSTDLYDRVASAYDDREWPTT